MLRPACALLLLTAIVSADDPSFPVPGGPVLGLQPSSDPAMTPMHLQPAESPTYPLSTAPLASQPQSDAAAAPIYSAAPITSGHAVFAADPFVSHASPLPMAAPATGCACNSGAAYSAGAIGVPAALPAEGAGYIGVGFGYEALGYGGGAGGYTGAFAAGMHVRHPYYSYRRPWYANGPMSHNVTIAW